MPPTIQYGIPDHIVPYGSTISPGTQQAAPRSSERTMDEDSKDDDEGPASPGHPVGPVIWFMASASTMSCIPVPEDLLDQVKQYWADRGGYAMHMRLPSGADSILIPQGGNAMVLLYQMESDCHKWLPMAAKIAAESR